MAQWPEEKMMGAGKWLLLAATTLYAAAGHAQTGQPAQVPSASEVANAAKTLHAMGDILKAKRAETEACIAAELKSDEAKPIASRIPAGGPRPTEAQYADKSLATKDEARAFKVVAPKLRACRVVFDDAETSFAPALGPVISDFESKHAALIADLIAGKLSWGDYYKQNNALIDEQKKRKAEVVQSLKSGS
jgi:hypothetical protein